MSSSSTVLRAPIPLPNRRYCEPPVRPPPLDPDSVEAKKVQEVHEHFAAEGYELETDGIRKPLEDEEKMYLVSKSHSVAPATADFLSRKSCLCGKSTCLISTAYCAHLTSIRFLKGQ